MWLLAIILYSPDLSSHSPSAVTLEAMWPKRHKIDGAWVFGSVHGGLLPTKSAILQQLDSLHSLCDTWEFQVCLLIQQNMDFPDTTAPS